MKKNKIRLTLNRETLRNLEQDELQATPGGAVLITYTCFNCVTQSCPTKCGQTYCYYV